MVVSEGVSLVLGMPEPLPLRGFPRGKVRIRMRARRPVEVYVKSKNRTVGYMVTERNGKWEKAIRIGANHKRRDK